MKFYEVGGCVRDSLMGKPSKDVDFVCIASSFEEMRKSLVDGGFRIWLEKPEFVTIRAQVPKGSALAERTRDADFVLARKDGPTADGRRPQFVEPGTLLDDLARRDLTMNAIARDVDTGEYVDPFNGMDDIRNGLIRFVGNPMDRIREDGLRVLRALRFSVTKGFGFAPLTWEALTDVEAYSMLDCVSVERIREEIEKMFAANTLRSLRLIGELPAGMQLVIFREGLRLSATLKT